MLYQGVDEKGCDDDDEAVDHNCFLLAHFLLLSPPLPLPAVPETCRVLEHRPAVCDSFD